MFAAANVEKVIRHLVRFGSTHAEAEDLAQEALLIAWRKKAEVDRDRSLDAWLFGIARNVYRNHVRSVRRSPMTDAPDADRIEAPPAITDALALRAALQTLPENQQDIVILHELEEYTLKETAELLAIPFDTAKDRLKRARDTLRATMSDDFATVGETERRDARKFSGVAAAGVLAGVLAVLARSGTAAGAGAGAVASSSGAGAVAATGTTVAAKIALGLVLVAAGIGVGVAGERLRWGRGDANVPPVVASAPPVVASTPHVVVAPPTVVAPPPVAVIAPPVATTRPAVPAPTTIAAVPDPAGPGADAEAQVIERARSAIARGRHDEALRTLMSHGRRFPTGQLAEERDVLLIDAYVGAGRLAIARERIEQFRAAYPASIHRAKVADLERDLTRQSAAPASP